jgi:hypothetical protein
MDNNGNGNMEKVVSKIRKLLALAGGGNPERAEAEAAMLKAQELLFAHSLTMGDVAFKEGEQEKKEVVEEGVAYGSGKKLSWWIKTLACTLANNFRCYIYIQNGYQKKKIVFMGLKQDVEVVKDVFQFAIAFGIKSWNGYRAKNYMKDYAQGMHSEKAFTTRTKNDYFTGYINGVKSKFTNQVLSKALILVKDALVTQEFRKLSLRPGTRANIKSGGRDGAYNKGYADGMACEKGKYIE